MDAVSPELIRRAQAGNVEAQIALGREFEVRNDTRRARACFAGAAKAGSVPALRMLAINLISNDPVIERDGVGMMQTAAARGDAEAEHICGMLAAQDGALEMRWPIALEHVERAAEAGFPLARSALEFLTTGSDAAKEDGTSRWSALTALIDPEAFVQSRPLTATLSEHPRVFVFARFVTPELCDWLIDRARRSTRRATVYDPEVGTGRKISGTRTNSSADFGVAQSDLVLMLVRNRIANSAGLPVESLESASILHYSPGEEFSEHYDFLDPSVPGFAQEVAAKGQRVATFLVYLNDDYRDGETEFPVVGLSFKGRQGDALLFWNVTEDGEPDPRTRHAGTPPTSGEKWIFSQWLRKRPGRRV